MAHLLFADTNEAGLDTLRRALDTGHRVTLLRGASRQLYTVNDSVTALFSRCQVIEMPVTSDSVTMTATVTAVHRRDPVDAVLCQLESAMEAVSIACERLGLPFTSAEGVANARDKARCRDLLAAAGLPGAAHALTADPDEAVAAAEKIGYPVVVKPVSGMDSLLARRADDSAQVRAAAEEILAGALSSPVQISAQLQRGILVEECLRGPLVSVELGLLAGTAYRFILSGRTRAAANECIELGAVLPANLSTAQSEACFDYAQQVCRVLGLDFGIFHIELIYTDRGPALVEVNPRVMGGVMTRLYNQLTGVDFADHILDLYQGHAPAVPPIPPRGTLAVRKIMPVADGRLPATLDLDWFDAPGDGIVDAFRYGLVPGAAVRTDQVLARYVAAGESWSQAVQRGDRLVQRIEQLLGIPLHHAAEIDRTGTSPAGPAAQIVKDAP